MAAAALLTLPRFAWAEAYPTRPVRIIVPFPAGQATDTIARLMGQSLSERLGQPFVIENRTGAGGKSDDQAHRPNRISLGAGNSRQRRQRGGARDQMKELTAGKCHLKSSRRNYVDAAG